MVWTVRAWIDDRHFAGADNISAGSGKRHRSGIAGDHPEDQRRKLDEFAQTRSKDIIPAWSAESMPSFIVGPGARSRALLPPSGSRIEGPGMWSKFGAGHRIDRHAPSRPP